MATAADKPWQVQIVSLANSVVLNEKEERFKMGLLWQKHKVLFVFLRHFACVACRAHAAEIWSKREMYQKGDTEIIFIGNGLPRYIQAFKEDLKILDAKMYTDPSLESFQAAGFHRGFLRALGPQSLINGRKLMKKGHTQGEYEKGMGDLWQLGGLLVITPAGKVAYHFISESTGDFPSEQEIEIMPAWASKTT
jgi:peroxiredoxin